MPSSMLIEVDAQVLRSVDDVVTAHCARNALSLSFFRTPFGVHFGDAARRLYALTALRNPANSSHANSVFSSGDRRGTPL